MTPYELAKKEVGTVEWAQGSNPKVLAYYRDAGHPEIKDDAVAWCAAFVGAMLKRAGIPNTGLLTARSYLKWGQPVMRKDAQTGDIVVFERGGSAWQGHVAFLVKDNGDTMTILGGNQRDSVSIATYKADDLLGIRRAPASKPQDAPKPVAAPNTPKPFKGILRALWDLLWASLTKGR
jgi:uncharacterized protein (TIGR02594 family)